MSEDDEEYVDDYESINLNNLRIKKGNKLEGGALELNISDTNEDAVYFAMPVFYIKHGLNIKNVSKNLQFDILKKHYQLTIFLHSFHLIYYILIYYYLLNIYIIFYNITIGYILYFRLLNNNGYRQ